MNAPVKKKSTFKCPDCDSPCRITSTKVLSRTYKEFYASCVNDACGGRYVFGGEPIRVLTPSQTPNPHIHLPLHNHAGHDNNADEAKTLKEKSC